VSWYLNKTDYCYLTSQTSECDAFSYEYAFEIRQVCLIYFILNLDTLETIAWHGPYWARIQGRAIGASRYRSQNFDALGACELSGTPRLWLV